MLSYPLGIGVTGCSYFSCGKESIRCWFPCDHLSPFILDAVDELDLRQVRVNIRGTGSEQYPPSMLLSLLLYSYATGVFSSRRIEQSTYESVPAHLIAGDSHPDHDTLCAFRRNNLALINESFVRVLEMAAQLKLLKVGQITVAVDGTKVMANASKHSAVSYQRSGELIQELELEVKQLMEKAEKAEVQAQAADGGAGVWDYQERAGVSQVHAAWIRESEAGVDPGKHRLQFEKTASSGGDGLKSKRSGMK